MQRQSKATEGLRVVSEVSYVDKTSYESASAAEQTIIDLRE